MQRVRTATPKDIELLARISAAAFYDDPLMSWVFEDASTRLARLEIVFAGLAGSFLPKGGVVYVVDDASAAYWRDPSFDHHPPAGAPATGDDSAQAESPFSLQDLERLGALTTAMTAAHPRATHWYLNVLSTVPPRQGEGLGARVMQPVLARCDAEGLPAYLESSNPRNITLYKRQGFEQTGEITLPGGPSLYPMWRDPR